MKETAAELHKRSIVVDGHNHIMHELPKRRLRGDRAVFSNYYAPLIREGGVNVLMLNVGGDNTTLTNGSDLLLWGSLWMLDMMREEAAESSDSIAVCLNSKDIDTALEAGKIAILLTLEGGRPLEGKPNYETLVGLRTFYNLGLRALQLVDNGRNRIGDGKGESRTKGGLTNFGISVVKEMNRLGMIIDVAHLSEPGFWDVIEVTKSPITDSHSNATALYNHPRNLTDEQIKAIVATGGLIGLSCNSGMICEASEKPTIDLFIRQVDHVAALVGIDHVGLGPDHVEFEIKHYNIWKETGWMEGVFYGHRDNYFVEGFSNITGFPLFTEALVKNGYSDNDIQKILGLNWLRFYKQIIG